MTSGPEDKLAWASKNQFHETSNPAHVFYHQHVQLSAQSTTMAAASSPVQVRLSICPSERFCNTAHPLALLRPAWRQNHASITPNRMPQNLLSACMTVWCKQRRGARRRWCVHPFDEKRSALL